MTASRGDQQSNQYSFPYHHLPHIDAQGMPHVGRTMRAGMEYLAYTHAVIDVVRGLAPATILDVGCGDGRLLVEAQEMVAEALGVDLDERAVGHARGFAPMVTFRAQSIESVDGLFDVVTCVETLEHIPDDQMDAFLAALADRVSVGGHLVLSVPTTARPVHAKHYRHYDVPTVSELLRALPGKWSILRLDEIVPYRRWFEQALRLLGNRYWTLDVPMLNRRILLGHDRPVAPRRRGLHVLAVAQRDE